ncbi:MAG: UvrD-helicase domain-containing protein [Clostridiales Family XIII bacterium]|jgi:ATP-dependent helicase/nuclease subunit A|nr:UvrD-helicase domain-containing protein [Clostridiales Family XIII bacterium]
MSGKFKKTDSQIKAINKRGSNILLSASAGSGKTTVLVARVISYILSGTSITSLFISTFTKNAAEKLKDDIENEIRKILKNKSYDGEKIGREEFERVRKALQELPEGYITNIDSFVVNLLKKYYYILNLNPDFRILAGTIEKEELRREVFENFLEEKLNGENEEKKNRLNNLIRNFSNDRSYIGFYKTVVSIYEYAYATENPDKWLKEDIEKGIRKYENFNNLTEHEDIIESEKIKKIGESKSIFPELKEFIKGFSEKYMQAKIRKNIFEFPDLNHFIIKILEENENIRNEYQENFEEILIDEYQDINGMQEKLLLLLGKANNYFMVGDIKQAIYNFRLSDPSLFLEKQKKYEKDKNTGELIRLRKNFRSSKEIIEFVNKVFPPLMKEIDYKKETLIYGKDNKEENSSEEKYPELILYRNEAGDEKMKSGEFHLIAEKILELHKKGIPFNEITILIRNKARFKEISDVFDKSHIPNIVIFEEGNFFDSLEIKIMISTLKAINNPLDDIALTAVLHSAMFSFTEEELLIIKIEGSEKTYYENLIKTKTNKDFNNEKLKEKINKFLKVFYSWRKYAKENSVKELISKIYVDKNYLYHVLTLINGKKREANLIALLNRAEHFEKNGYRGLIRFLNMIEVYLENDSHGEFGVVSPDLDESSVKIMTIHKSKGLEFNYVFVTDLNHIINKMDMHKDFLITKENGCTIREKLKIENGFIKYESLPYTKNKTIKLEMLIEEELRLLYVAMTRAKEKLYLTATLKEKEKMEKYKDKIFKGFLDESLRSEGHTRYIDWILGVIFSIENENKEDFIGKEIPVKVKIYSKIPPIHEREKFRNSNFIFFERIFEKASKENLYKDEIKKIETILNYEDSPEIKRDIQKERVLTVSKITKRNYPLFDLDSENEVYISLRNDEEYTKPFYRQKIDWDSFLPLKEEYTHRIIKRESENDIFNITDFSDEKNSMAILGNLTHELLQRVDFSNSNLRESFEEALNEINAADMQKEKLKEKIEGLISFFEKDDIGKKIRAAKNLKREQPFSMLLDGIIIKGIIDGFIENDDDILLFDYKTDRIKNFEELKARYEDQLSFYRIALERNYKKHVKTVLIHIGNTVKAV